MCSTPGARMGKESARKRKRKAQRRRGGDTPNSEFLIYKSVGSAEFRGTLNAAIPN
ncbi:hypothetical protein [Brasilonema bromeliae]|uniref:hypothetical protein n=1 Tax=Brasilonema bromeliae TaxID=383615 RepID=UPI00145E8121|nr:hypothetical protein [Brasilonema bromeliae]